MLKVFFIVIFQRVKVFQPFKRSLSQDLWLPSLTCLYQTTITGKKLHQSSSVVFLSSSLWILFIANYRFFFHSVMPYGRSLAAMLCNLVNFQSFSASLHLVLSEAIHQSYQCTLSSRPHGVNLSLHYIFISFCPLIIIMPYQFYIFSCYGVNNFPSPSPLSFRIRVLYVGANHFTIPWI